MWLFSLVPLRKFATSDEFPASPRGYRSLQIEDEKLRALIGRSDDACLGPYTIDRNNSKMSVDFPISRRSRQFDGAVVPAVSMSFS